EAVKALLEGRRVKPENDNALYYYNQVLAIDPYDLSAYEGKKSLVADLKSTYADLVYNADFETAFETVKALQVIEPLEASNYELQENLEAAITEHVEKVKTSGTAEEVEDITALLEKLGPQLQSTQTAAAALQNEKVLLESIDKALAENNLIPPQTGNAYAIVSEALQKNTISKVNFAPRISALSEKLVDSANKALSEDSLEEAETLTALVKRLDVDPENLALLESKVEERKAAIAAEEAEQANEEVASTEENQETDVAAEEVVEEEPEVAKIIPAKIISRSAPRYPSRALDREIEGWVSIGFEIDTEGLPQNITVVESEPSDTFDSAAIAAVKKWRFSPAMNETTQEPVTSRVDATKLQFKLE
ncbi:MAG: energy transducer TonB, partial [Acidiferrobacterales bacterium]|nr:energy transducer TonB [Acidiferrobacterales bacterium]